MSWLRNLLVFPDDVWEEAARKLGGDFVKGRWLADSKIKLLHRDHPITLEVDTDDGTHYTRAIPGASLRPKVRLQLTPKWKGVLGSLAGGLLARTGKAIDLPVLDDDFTVFGNKAELANGLFGHPDFVSALRRVSPKPTVRVGMSMSVDEEQEKFCVFVPRVLKNVHELIAIVDLTKVLVDLLEENRCLEYAQPISEKPTEEESSRIIGSIIGWGLAGIALLIGLTGLLNAGWNFKQDRASLSWPETTGRIINSDVEVAHRSDDFTKYEVRVHYAYDVYGQAHESRRLRFSSNGFEERSEANKLRRRFRSGEEVSVYYDPANPARAVLLRGTQNHWPHFIAYGICLTVSLLIFTFMCWATFRGPS